MTIFNSQLLVLPKALPLDTSVYSDNTWQCPAVAKSIELQPQ